MCDVICRSVVSSGGLFEHGELPDFTKAGKFFASSLIIDCLPAILVTRDGQPTNHGFLAGARSLPLLQEVQTSSLTHPASIQ